MHTCWGKEILGALGMLLWMASTACRADAAEQSSQRECQSNCRSAQLIERSWQPVKIDPSSFTAQPNPGRSAIRRPTVTSRAVMDWQPPDTHWVAKLRGIRELRLLTLWQSDAARIFLGVTENGLAGLAFSSRQPKRTRKSKRTAVTSNEWRLQQSSLINY